jgi:hypothetical protein
MKKICSLLSFLFLFLFLTSCQKEVTEVANPPQEFKPNGNEILTTEKLIGTDKQHSSFEKAIDDGLGNFYFAGYINEQNVIDKIDKQGFIIWQKSINFKVNEIVLFYAEGNLNLEKSALIVGNDGDKSVIAIYDRNGTKLSDAYFNDFAINTFNDVRFRYSANNYYLCSAIGGAGNGTNDVAPYWVNFTVSANGQISKSIPNVSLPTQVRLTQYSGTRFNKFDIGFIEGSNSQGGVGGIPNSVTSKWETYITYLKYGEQGTGFVGAGMVALDDNTTYNRLNRDVVGIDLKVKWQRGIFEGNSLDDIGFLNKSFASFNEITIVGSGITKNGKATNISSNGYSAVKIVVLNRTNGTIISNREFPISQHSDVVANVVPLVFADANGNLNVETYICGVVSNYSKNDYFYGYGWIAKLSGGTITNIRHFGLPEGRHYFYSIVPTEQDIYAFGFKNYVKKDGGHKAWFTQVNRNRL